MCFQRVTRFRLTGQLRTSLQPVVHVVPVSRASGPEDFVCAERDLSVGRFASRWTSRVEPGRRWFGSFCQESSEGIAQSISATAHVRSALQRHEDLRSPGVPRLELAVRVGRPASRAKRHQVWALRPGSRGNRDCGKCQRQHDARSQRLVPNDVAPSPAGTPQRCGPAEYAAERPRIGRCCANSSPEADTDRRSTNRRVPMEFLRSKLAARSVGARRCACIQCSHLLQA